MQHGASVSFAVVDGHRVASPHHHSMKYDLHTFFLFFFKYFWTFLFSPSSLFCLLLWLVVVGLAVWALIRSLSTTTTTTRAGRTRQRSRRLRGYIRIRSTCGAMRRSRTTTTTTAAQSTVIYTHSVCVLCCVGVYLRKLFGGVVDKKINHFVTRWERRRRRRRKKETRIPKKGLFVLPCSTYDAPSSRTTPTHFLVRERSVRFALTHVERKTEHRTCYSHLVAPWIHRRRGLHHPPPWPWSNWSEKLLSCGK